MKPDLVSSPAAGGEAAGVLGGVPSVPSGARQSCPARFHLQAGE